MDFHDRDSLINEAHRRLDNARCDHKRLVMIYAGVTAAVMALVTVVTYWLQGQISETGGLSGIGLRSVLETAVTVLQVGSTAAMPFWTMGYVFCIMGVVRGLQMEPRDLLGGFRRFAPLLKLNLYRVFKYFITGMLCLYPSIVIYLMTPLAQPVMDILEPFVASATDTAQVIEMMDDATMMAVTEAMAPWMGVYAVMFLLLAAPLFYRLRMADYLLLDDPKMGAMAAVRYSTQLTFRKRWELFKLDLRFWWFYAGLALCTVVCYVPVILPWVGVVLPLWADYACYGGYLVMQFGLCVLAQNRVEATYVVAYETLLQSQQSQQ